MCAVDGYFVKIGIILYANLVWPVDVELYLSIDCHSDLWSNFGIEFLNFAVRFGRKTNLCTNGS